MPGSSFLLGIVTSQVLQFWEKDESGELSCARDVPGFICSVSWIQLESGTISLGISTQPATPKLGYHLYTSYRIIQPYEQS